MSISARKELTPMEATGLYAGMGRTDGLAAMMPCKDKLGGFPPLPPCASCASPTMRLTSPLVRAANAKLLLPGPLVGWPGYRKVGSNAM